MQIIFTDGLGNQMFQYALYLAMKARGRKPSINIGIAMRNIVHNGFELCKAFQIEKESLPIIMDNKFLGGITLLAIRKFSKIFCYKENIELYSNEVFHTNKLFISGYWQDFRYFENIEDEVRRSFNFRGIDKMNQILSNEMKSCNSVSIHIRRGDYLKYSNYQVCTPLYYQRAILYIKERVNNPIFYVFSDDLTWSNNFMSEQGVDYYIVNQNRGQDSYKDMFLMTNCLHNIIANSSFSWWGAWLGMQTDKIVVCPNLWLNNSPKDLSLEKWHKINVSK